MRRLVALLLVVAALGGACSGDDDDDDRPDDGDTEETTAATAAPIRGGRLVVGLEGTIGSLDPAAAPFTPSELTAALAVFDPLLVTSDTGEVVPYLAASFEGSADDTRWTIGLRPDVTFSDGAPVDAAAVVASFDRVLASPALQGAMRRLRGVTAVDDHAVELTTDPWPELPTLLTGQLGLVAAGEIGSGPFVVESSVPGDRIVLARNQRHWRWEADGLPRLDELELQTVASAEDRVAQLVRGDVDVIHVAGDAALDALWDAEDVRVAETATSGRAVVLVTNPDAVPDCVAVAATGEGGCDDAVDVVLRTDQPDAVLEPLVATLADGNVTVDVERVDAAALATDELVGSFDAIVRVDDGLIDLVRLDGAPVVRTVVDRVPWAYGAAPHVGGLLGDAPLPDGDGAAVAIPGVLVPVALHRTESSPG